VEPAVDQSGSLKRILAHVHTGMRDTFAERYRTQRSWQARPSQLVTVQSKSKLTAQLPALAGAAKERVYLWRRRAATIATGALALIMAYGVIFGHNGLTTFVHKREEARSLQQQMQQLQTENDRLHERVDRLQNDPSAIEHEAREELHYTRVGEVIYTLPDESSDSAKTPASKP
jgi:cell division protein FtsB